MLNLISYAIRRTLTLLLIKFYSYENVKIWLLCVLSLTSACITMDAQTVKQVIIPEQGYEGFYIKHDDKTPATIIEILENRYLLYMDEKKQMLTISLFEKGQTIARETTPVIAIKYDEDNFYYLDPECKRENYYIDKMFLMRSSLKTEKSRQTCGLLSIMRIPKAGRLFCNAAKNNRQPLVVIAKHGM